MQSADQKASPSPARLRRAKIRQETRERFLESAESAFRERTYESVTIEQVAAAAGYSKRAIYLYFRDKRELFESVLCRELDRWNDSLKAIERTRTEPLSQLALILTECLEYVDRDPILLRHLHEAWALAASDDADHPSGRATTQSVASDRRTRKDPAALGRAGSGDSSAASATGGTDLESRFAALVRIFVRCLDRAAIEGTLPPQADPTVEAQWIWSQVVGVLVTTRGGNATNRSGISGSFWADASARILSGLTGKP